MKLILKLVTLYGRATSVRARRVTRLNHELFNAAMKCVPVVVGVARMYCKVLNCLWNSFVFYSKQFKKVLIFYKRNNLLLFIEELKLYIALGGVYDS